MKTVHCCSGHDSYLGLSIFGVIVAMMVPQYALIVEVVNTACM